MGTYQTVRGAERSEDAYVEVALGIDEVPNAFEDCFEVILFWFSSDDQIKRLIDILSIPFRLVDPNRGIG